MYPSAWVSLDSLQLREEISYGVVMSASFASVVPGGPQGKLYACHLHPVGFEGLWRLMLCGWQPRDLLRSTSLWLPDLSRRVSLALFH